MSYSHKEKLIDLVKSYPVLWKITRKSRGLKQKYWEVVGAELGTTGFDARRQWEILRDQIRREDKRCKQDPHYQSKWILYPKMLFSLQQKEGSSSTACSDDGEQYHSSDQFVKQEAFYFTPRSEEPSGIQVRKDLRESNDSRSIDGGYSPSPPPPTMRVMPQETVVATVIDQNEPSTSAAGVSSSTQLHLQLQQQHCRPPPRLYKFDLDIPEPQTKRFRSNPYSICEEDDEDYYFAMSLVPSLRCIPRSRKLKVRAKMLELVASAIENAVEDDELVKLKLEPELDRDEEK